MLSVVAAAYLAAVPSPGRAVLDRVTTHEVLVAEADRAAEADLERDMDGAKKRVGRDRGEQGERKQTKKLRLSPEERVLVDGHGKGYFLAWGLVDWGLAGGSWFVSLTSGLLALTAASIARNIETYGDDAPELDPFASRAEARRGYRQAAVFFGALWAVTGGLGGLFVYKGSHHISTYRDIREREAALLLGKQRGAMPVESTAEIAL